MVQWLRTGVKTAPEQRQLDHERRYQHSIDEAALSGSLKLVQWLYVHRSGECSATAMDNAVLSGNMDFVR